MIATAADPAPILLHGAMKLLAAHDAEVARAVRLMGDKPRYREPAMIARQGTNSGRSLVQEIGAHSASAFFRATIAASIFWARSRLTTFSWANRARSIRLPSSASKASMS